MSYVSHNKLIESVKEEILNDFKDLLLEAISAKLSTYEKSNANYTINTKSRISYSNQEQQP